MNDSNFIYFSKVFVSGGIGGCCLTLSGHPLDTIKVTIQTMKQVDGKMPFNNAFDCAKKIIVSFNFLRTFLKILKLILIFINLREQMVSKDYIQEWVNFSIIKVRIRTLLLK